jgi:tetratricopeptide (TPR) repeat protein
MGAVAEKLELRVTRFPYGFQQIHGDRLPPMNLCRDSKLHVMIVLCYDCGMSVRIKLILALAATLINPAFAQTTTNVTIQRDLRLFTTMAALNVAGFDVEFGNQYAPVREEVRKYATEVDPDLVARLKAFYASRKGNQTDEAQLPKYISLAVNLTDAPAFKPLTREEVMPPDARSVLGFEDLMREFYEKAHLSRHWLELRARYDRAIAQVGPALRDLIVRTDAYMRVPLGGFASRSMAIYLELAAPINTVNLRSNQDSYYVIIGDSSSPRADDIRHAYLHFQLDNLVASNVAKIQNSTQLLNLVKKAEGVDPAYTTEFHVMTAESLIRALELRMDRLPAVRARENVDTFYRSGLLFVPYFYSALEAYEKGDVSLRESFAPMLRNIQLQTEQARFDQTFYKIPVPQKTVARPEVPQPPPAPPADPTRDLLKEAETAFNAGDTTKAQAAFERVLSDFDRENGSAMYGLALIASKKGDSNEAQQYFERTIRSNSSELGMKVWSYIYLARIFDLECSRPRAIEYYQQAIKVGDNTRNAQAAAREGVQKPYGDGCR